MPYVERNYFLVWGSLKKEKKVLLGTAGVFNILSSCVYHSGSLKLSEGLSPSSGSFVFNMVQNRVCIYRGF